MKKKDSYDKNWCYWLLVKKAKLRNEFLKNLSPVCTKQNNMRVFIDWKEMRNCFSSFTEKDVIDNKEIWETNKSFLSNRVKSPEYVNLAEARQIIVNKGKSYYLQQFNSKCIKENIELLVLNRNTSTNLISLVSRLQPSSFHF